MRAFLQLQLKMSTEIDTSTLNKLLIWYQCMLKSTDSNIFLMWLQGYGRHKLSEYVNHMYSLGKVQIITNFFVFLFHFICVHFKQRELKVLHKG